MYNVIHYNVHRFIFLPNPFKIEANWNNIGKIHNVPDEIHEELQKHDQKHQRNDPRHNHKAQEVGHGTRSEGDLETPAGTRKSVQARAYTGLRLRSFLTLKNGLIFKL